jgi:hypothetical protein
MDRHIAAAGVEKVDFGTGGAHEVDAVLHCHQELLMAVTAIAGLIRRVL